MSIVPCTHIMCHGNGTWSSQVYEISRCFVYRVVCGRGEGNDWRLSRNRARESKVIFFFLYNHSTIYAHKYEIKWKLFSKVHPVIIGCG